MNTAQPDDTTKPFPEQHPAEIPPAAPNKDDSDRKDDKGKNWPPDSIPNPMPGVDPQQTPGIDRLGATA